MRHRHLPAPIYKAAKLRRTQVGPHECCISLRNAPAFPASLTSCHAHMEAAPPALLCVHTLVLFSARQMLWCALPLLLSLRLCSGPALLLTAPCLTLPPTAARLGAA